MHRCGKCGKEIRFIKRKNNKALIVNLNPNCFVPDLSGDIYFIYDGAMRRGRISTDGLKGYTLHNCEAQ